MRKRTIIAIIITILVMFLTNKTWLIIKPIPVDFNVAGKGNITIEVQFNKKDNNEFKKIKSETRNIDLSNNKHFYIEIERAKYPKRFRIIFSNLEPNSALTIKDIQIRGGKYKLNNLKNFKVDNGKLEIKQNKLIITPQNNIVTLLCDETIKVRASIRFIWEIFAIILILTFLLSYKITDYLADFKTIKNHSRIDIIFLSIFFIFLFIPMSHINQDKKSMQENRMLAKWKPLITKNGEMNYNFGKDYNEWFNDRFNLRQFFLNTNDLKLVLSRNWITKDVMKGSNDWLFLGWKESRDSYTNSIMFTNEELASIDNYLGSINNYCKIHNKHFYFIIAPDKSKIYPEYYPQSIKKLSDVSRTKQLIDYVKNHSNVKIVYPKDRLISQKGKHLLYWKNDTHWNLLGAYYGYSELMNMIVEDYNKIPVYKISNYTTENHTGDLYNMSPAILRRMDSTSYTIPKIDDNHRCEQPKEPRGIVACSNSTSKVNLLMFRDSFSTSLIPYLSYTFGQSRYIWKYAVNPNAMNNADIIILEVVERGIPALVGKKMER